MGRRRRWRRRRLPRIRCHRRSSSPSAAAAFRLIPPSSQQQSSSPTPSSERRARRRGLDWSSAAGVSWIRSRSEDPIAPPRPRTSSGVLRHFPADAPPGIWGASRGASGRPRALWSTASSSSSCEISHVRTCSGPRTLSRIRHSGRPSQPRSLSRTSAASVPGRPTETAPSFPSSASRERTDRHAAVQWTGSAQPYAAPPFDDASVERGTDAHSALAADALATGSAVSRRSALGPGGIRRRRTQPPSPRPSHVEAAGAAAASPRTFSTSSSPTPDLRRDEVCV
mmetsp:Transcript_6044/g.17658  ORF Transcript_6044/g.17658 Transcript_6044/m.17658 type:complete len:283 (+) Transcript_6044:286-1134(+)